MERKKSGEVSSAPATTAASDAPPPPLPPPETLTEVPRRRGPGGKRKAAAADATSAPSKRLAKERDLVLQQLAPQAFHSGPITRARQIPKLQNIISESQKSMPQKASQADLARVVGGEGGRKAGSAVAELEEEGFVDETAVEAEFEAIRMCGATAHVVPTHAGWFSWSNVHPLEKHTLTSFFTDKSKSRTPEIYMEIRNSIMKKFHSNPGTQLETKDLDELPAGDRDARREVMEFLDHWGLINFHPFPPSNSNHVVPKSNINDSPPTANETSDMIDKLYQFEAVQSHTSFPPKKPLVNPAGLPSFLPESIITNELVKAEGPSVEYHCNSCSADCSRKRYHCQTQIFDLCTECYNDGKFDSGMAPSDFILMESAEVHGVSGGNWTDQETLLLLEALELFAENWNEIAEHVATKTKTQCILHFLQMPIEDSFFGNENHAGDDNTNNVDSSPTDQESSLLVHESKATGNGDTKSSGNNDNVKDSADERKIDHAENKETRRNDDEAVSHSMKYSKTSAEAQVSCDPSDNLAFNILKSAFKAVGCLPQHGELLSFAEAGNPAMALAAFLAGLAGSKTALASTRSSLKALDEESPGIHLAARHCFLLEDPSDNKNDLPAETATNNMESGEADKDKGQTETCTKHDVDATSLVNVKDSTQAAEECLHEQALPSSLEDGDAKKNSNVNANGMEIDQANKVEGAFLEKLAREEKTNPAQAVSKQTGNGQLSDAPKALDSVRGLACPEESDSHERAGLESLVECKMNGDGDIRHQSSKGEEGRSTGKAANNHGIDRIRCAAVTALSAAAVKAKLLAKDEEEQILQLVSLAIEKQLYKLETKISFLSDIDNVFARVREQTEKARQRLFQERAQIIAARLGLPASSARGNLPNKLPMGYSGIRPPLMALQRPPPLRKS